MNGVFEANSLTRIVLFSVPLSVPVGKVVESCELRLLFSTTRSLNSNLFRNLLWSLKPRSEIFYIYKNSYTLISAGGAPPPRFSQF